jgi:hypothetical protein
MEGIEAIISFGAVGVAMLAALAICTVAMWLWCKI